MANLSITARCNRDCDYCFAKEALAALAGGRLSMSMPVFEQSLDFLERSGIRELRLLGGEPTVHPQFPEMVARAVARGFRLRVFSGGLVPERALDVLCGIAARQLAVLVNVIPPDEGPPAVRRKQERVLQLLGLRASLGLNIADPGVELAFLLDWIARFGLSPGIRLGIAHPVPEGGNRFLHPRHYGEVGRRVAAFGRRARESGVRLTLDCGWVPCMFPPGALEVLGIDPAEAGRRCNPILDILPDGSVISCYPLASRGRERLPTTRDAAWLRRRFHTTLTADRAFTLYPHCRRCSWRERGACTGGCLAAALRRQRRTEFAFSLPAPVACADSEHRARRRQATSRP